MAPAIDPYGPMASPPPYNLGSEEVRSQRENPPPEVQENQPPAEMMTRETEENRPPEETPSRMNVGIKNPGALPEDVGNRIDRFA